MKELVLIGSGGCMRELLWQLEMQKEWQITGYVDLAPYGGGEITAGGNICPYLGGDEYLLSKTQPVNVAICVGEPNLRKKIAQNLMGNPNILFPNIILDDVKICPSARLGKGCVISMGCRISTDTVLGDFVFFNMETLFCHNGSVGAYSSLAPRVSAAGNVTIGEECNIGIGTKIIQGVTIGDMVITGAGTVVIRDVESHCTVVGVPARRIK